MQELIRCRICYSDKLKQVLDFGEQYVINFGDKPSLKLPIKICLCQKCGLVQSMYIFDGDLFFRQYYYKSGINQTMRAALKDIVTQAMKIVDPCDGDVVCDIASNDGTLLRFYPPNLTKIGFEPAINLCTKENYPNSRVINAYFSDNWGLPKAKIITAIAMLYSVNEINLFVNSVKNTLHREGVFIIQLNWLGDILGSNDVGDFTHEHCCFYSVRCLKTLLSRCELEIFRIEHNDVNGGSIRCYIKHANCDHYDVGPEVELYDIIEKDYNKVDTFEDFKTSVDWIGAELYSFIKAHGPVWALGASTRGNTMLQMFGIDNTLITAVADRNPDKNGTRMVGTDILVVSEETWRKENPPYTLILPWYFAPEIMEREKNYLAAGGKFIIPLPEFSIHG